MKKTTEALHVLLAAMILTGAPVSADPPEVTKAEPSQGFVDEHTEVTLSGEGFDSGARVTLLNGGVYRTAAIESPGWPQDVAVVGNYAYVAHRYNPFRIFDISDPANPLVVSELNLATRGHHLAVAGSYAYLVSDSGLQIMDVSDPSALLLLGSIDTPGTGLAVAVSGAHAFVADGPRGLQIIDVSDPLVPLIVGNFQSSFRHRSYDVAVSGNLVYVGNGGHGLQIVDVSEPHAPQLIGSIPYGAFHCSVDGNRAYITDYYLFLQIIDISDPSRPTGLGEYRTMGNPEDLSVVDDQVYLVATRRSSYDKPYLEVIDAGDPGNPTLLSHIEMNGIPVGVTASNGFAYVTVSLALAVYDARDPMKPAARMGSASVPRNGRDVAVLGDHAFVAGYDDGLHVIDVRNPAAPVPVGRADIRSASGVAVHGRHAYITDYDIGLHIVDVGDPSYPRHLGSVRTPGKARDVAVSGEFAYVADLNSGLQIIDASTPEEPVIVGRLPLLRRVLGVAVVGEHAYLAADYNGLHVIDVRDPRHPVKLRTVQTPGMAMSVIASQSHAYVADGHTGLQVIDVTEPSQAVLVGSVGIPRTSRDVALSRGLAYVAADHAGLQVVDVNNPSQPVLIELASVDTPGMAWAIAVIDDYAYVVEYEGPEPVFHVIRVNPPFEDVYVPSSDQAAFIAPPDLNPGVYHVELINPNGERGRLHNGYRVCERRELTCTLEPIDHSPPARSTWRITLTGDDAFFALRSRHEAMLLLPSLPSNVELHEVPAKGSGRTTIELHIFPRHDRATVRLVGADVEGLWDQMRSAGGTALKRLDDRAYGDITLSVSPNPAGNSPVGHGAGRGRRGAGFPSQPTTRYRYDFRDGQLREARAFGPDADLVLEVVARDKYHCETVERISLLEAMGGQTN